MHACSGITDPFVEDDPDIRAFVTGAAANALEGNGRFRFDTVIPTAPDGMPSISPTFARQLGRAFVASYGEVFLPTWQSDRGGGINLPGLSVSARVYPAHSAFGAVPEAGCHPYFARLFGSYYMMMLNDGTDPQVRLAVSARLTDFGVNNEGALIEPPRTGQDFISDGIPVDHGVAFLLTPEQAVAIVARLTGVKVRSVPRLMLRGDYSPNWALWRIELDAAVRVARTDGTELTTSVIYVGPNANQRLLAATANQPTTVTKDCLRVDEKLVNTGFATVIVPVLEGQPTQFEPVVLLR